MTGLAFETFEYDMATMREVDVIRKAEEVFELDVPGLAAQLDERDPSNPTPLNRHSRSSDSMW